MNLNVFYGILIPFVGTSAGAACVFFMKKDLRQWMQRCLTGFAAGVMVAASVWSLLIPAIEQSEGMGKLSFMPAVLGFWAGVLFLLLLDHIIPHLHQQTDKAEGPKSNLQRTTMLVLAVTLHNIPEGMAVVSDRKCADYIDGSACIVAWNRNPEFSGGRNYLHAASFRGNGQDEGLCGRRFVRNRGTNRCSTDDSGGRSDRTGITVSSELCGRGYALCCCRRVDSGDVCWEAFQYRNNFLCGWIHSDDAPGCSTGVRMEN